jgi:hypothetical protein
MQHRRSRVERMQIELVPSKKFSSCFELVDSPTETILNIQKIWLSAKCINHVKFMVVSYKIYPQWKWVISRCSSSCALIKKRKQSGQKKHFCPGVNVSQLRSLGYIIGIFKTNIIGEKCILASQSNNGPCRLLWINWCHLLMNIKIQLLNAKLCTKLYTTLTKVQLVLSLHLAIHIFIYFWNARNWIPYLSLLNDFYFNLVSDLDLWLAQQTKPYTFYTFSSNVRILSDWFRFI